MVTQGECETPFQDVPVLLRILQHVLSMAETEDIDKTAHINQIRGWIATPSVEALHVLIRSLAQHLEDTKYMEAADNWFKSGKGLEPSGIKDDIYSNAYFTKKCSN